MLKTCMLNIQLTSNKLVLPNSRKSIILYKEKWKNYKVHDFIRYKSIVCWPESWGKTAKFPPHWNALRQCKFV